MHPFLVHREDALLNYYLWDIGSKWLESVRWISHKMIASGIRNDLLWILELMESWDYFCKLLSKILQLFKQKITDDKQRITVLPTICSDPNFKLPLQVVSKLLGRKWKDGTNEEIQIGEVNVFRRNFGNFKAKYKWGLEKIIRFLMLQCSLWSFILNLFDRPVWITTVFQQSFRPSNWTVNFDARPLT